MKVYGQCPNCGGALTVDHLAKCTQRPVGLDGIDQHLYAMAHHIAADIVAPWVYGDPCEGCTLCVKVCAKMLERTTRAVYNLSRSK